MFSRSYKIYLILIKILQDLINKILLRSFTILKDSLFKIFRDLGKNFKTFQSLARLLQDSSLKILQDLTKILIRSSKIVEDSSKILCLRSSKILLKVLWRSWKFLKDLARFLQNSMRYLSFEGTFLEIK